LLMTEMMNRHTRFNTIAMGHLLRVLSWVAWMRMALDSSLSQLMVPL
jgi:hypothetical protein